MLKSLDTNKSFWKYHCIQKVKQNESDPKYIAFTFTFIHLANTFIQSYLLYIALNVIEI